MDLVAIMQSIWRWKLVTIPVLLLTIAGIAYEGVLKPATYSAQASYILLAPPAPPTADQVAKDPALAKVNTNNPYLRFGDLSIVVSLLAQTMTTQSEQQAIVRQGGDPRYTVGLSDAYATGAPIVQIQGIGDSPTAAIRTVQIVGAATKQMLYTLQAAQGTNSTYMITTLPISTPATATPQVSSKLRTVIAVFVAGMILLFMAISTMSGLAERRAKKRPLKPAADEVDDADSLPQQPLAVASQARLGHLFPTWSEHR
jgi:hypothetical protein